MEILAPAGSESALIAAVQSGADAVYIGGNKFSARSSATNFSVDEMKKWIDYCHIRDVDVHIAANILIKEKEKNEFIEYLGKLNEIGADAVIIQDIGMAKVLSECFPDLPLHASTQLTAASLDAVKFLEGEGFSRVVLSRELSFEEIEYISKNATAEIEVFGHGALCMSYSGQCLMSSIIGGRSGNRGRCAQPCRLPYNVTDGKKVYKDGYILSPKDLCLVEDIERLKKANVASLKIEGRLKRPEYVATVVKIYSGINNSLKKPEKTDIKVLENAFNRNGFTKGYFINRKGTEMMSLVSPGNMADNKFPKDIEKLCSQDANERKVKIDMFARLKSGESLEITVVDDKLNSVTQKSELKAEKANYKPITKERLSEQLTKLGNTPYEVNNLEVSVDDGVILPISEINSIRRQVIEELSAVRTKRPARRRINFVQQLPTDLPEGDKFFSAQVTDFKQAEVVLEYDIPVIYAPENVAKMIKEMDNSKKVITVLPPVWREKDKKQYYIADGVLVSNIGQIYAFSDYDCYGSPRLNVFNNNTVEFYKNLKSLSVSYELNTKEIKSLIPYTSLEATVYGKIPLMLMENCPKKMYGSCKEKLWLSDRKREKFPLLCAPGCYSELLNAKPIIVADKMCDINSLPVSIFKLNFTNETKEECRKVLDLYLKTPHKSIDIKENTFTRGHYWRGVE